MNRRECLQQLNALACVSLAPSSFSMTPTIRQRAIPVTGELLPVVGLGTWQTFDVSPSADERAPLRGVLKNLLSLGGSVVDSSPMYGRSEEVVGELSTELGINQNLFIATKVWTRGRENGIRQMNESFGLLKREKIELMQIHNLTDWQAHLPVLRRWKEEGRIRYIGLTHYTSGAHQHIISILEKEQVDFIQINYNLLEREAANRLLPMAMEKKVAVLINQPFGGGGMFGQVRGKELPGWASEFDCKSWAQFFLKYILANPAVTCVIPGTSKPHHMLDNLAAGVGALPSPARLHEMVRLMAG